MLGDEKYQQLFVPNFSGLYSRHTVISGTGAWRTRNQSDESHILPWRRFCQPLAVSVGCPIVSHSAQPSSSASRDITLLKQELISNLAHVKSMQRRLDKLTGTQNLADKKSQLGEETAGISRAEHASSDYPNMPSSKCVVTGGKAYRADTAVLNLKYKTSICKHFARHLSCPLGENCHFAHGYCELRGMHQHPLYKSRMCVLASENLCPHGEECFFAHCPREVRSKAPDTTTTIYTPRVVNAVSGQDLQSPKMEQALASLRTSRNPSSTASEFGTDTDVPCSYFLNPQNPMLVAMVDRAFATCEHMVL